MRVQLRAKRSRRINVNLILHDCARIRVLNLPTALIEFVKSKRSAGTIFGANPIYVLREVADLVKSVPDRELKFALSGSGGQHNLNLYQVLLGRRKRNRIS